MMISFFHIPLLNLSFNKMNKIYFSTCIFLTITITLKAQSISSKDLLMYKNFVNLSNDFAKQIDPELFEYDDNLDIYDISNNSDKSYIAVIGCFRHKMSCKSGMDFFIFKWDKKRNLLLLIEKVFNSRIFVDWGKR
jgi:hypothetical protein